MYGIGQLVHHAPSFIAPVLADVIKGCVAIIQAPESREADNNNATENAISTLGALMSHCWFVTTLVFRA